MAVSIKPAGSRRRACWFARQQIVLDLLHLGVSERILEQDQTGDGGEGSGNEIEENVHHSRICSGLTIVADDQQNECAQLRTRRINP